MRNKFQPTLMACVMLVTIFLFSPFGFASNELCLDLKLNDREGEIRGILYSIKHHENGSKAYLLGSLHGGHDELNALPKYIVNKLSETKKVFNEMDMAADELIKVGRAVWFLDGNRNLKNILSGSTYSRLSRYIDSLNLSEPDKMKIDKVTPYKLLGSVQYKNPENDAIKSLDAQLDFEVSRLGIPRDGIEVAEDVITAIRSITDEEWDAYTVGLLDLSECAACVKRIEQLNACIPKLVRDGDADGIALLNENYNNDHPWRAAFYRKFVQSRNKKMAERISQVMNTTNPIFVSLGASHLGGKLGVIQRLRDMGYKVEQVKE